VTRMNSTCELNRNPDRCGLREKAGQFGDRGGSRRPR
jgi:hypothetical protein